MKKKILMSVTAVAMAFAMATTSFAATPTDSGDVDVNGVVNSNDSSMIQKEAENENDLTNGNFDGYWQSKSVQMTGNDARRSLEYVLVPETMVETLGVRAYATDGSDSTGGFTSDVINIWDELFVDSDRTEWNQMYTDNSADLLEESNHTIDETLAAMAEAIDGSNESIEEFAKFLSGVSFQGFGERADDLIFLTNDDGWGVFAVCMREIVPLSQEDFVNSGYADYITDDTSHGTVFNGDYGIVGDAPYTKISDLPADLQKRAEAFEALKAKIVTNTAHNEGENNTAIDSVTYLYEQFKIAFPSAEITEQQFRDTCDHFGAIYTRRYDVSVSDEKNGTDYIPNNADGENNSATINNMAAAKLYQYETATLQDVRDCFGDRIEFSTTKDGEKTWGFVIEIYSQYKPASELISSTKLN